jgi:Transposase
MAMRKREESPEVFPNAAGIDVGGSSHWVAVPRSTAEEPVREFGTMTDDLNAMADWLLACGIDTVALESTGVYWIPVYEVLEQRGLTVWLVDARQMKYVPGRKSDVQDCQWLQKWYGRLPTRRIAEVVGMGNERWHGRRGIDDGIRRQYQGAGFAWSQAPECRACDQNTAWRTPPRVKGRCTPGTDARALDPSDVVVHLDAVPAPSIKVPKLEDHGDLHRQTGGRHEADSSWYRHCKKRLSGASHRRGDR